MRFPPLSRENREKEKDASLGSIEGHSLFQGEGKGGPARFSATIGHDEHAYLGKLKKRRPILNFLTGGVKKKALPLTSLVKQLVCINPCCSTGGERRARE